MHDIYGNEDLKRAPTGMMVRVPTLAVEVSAGKRLTRSRVLNLKASASQNESPGPARSVKTKEKPTLHVQEVKPKHDTRLRLPHPRVSASQNDKKSGLTIEESAGTRITRSCVLNSKASTSQNELSGPAPIGRMKEQVKTKDNVPKSRRSPLFYQPKDEISLLQICVNLKDVVALGHISGFWCMVQDTLQVETGKPYERVGRHVRSLVCKRRAEQQEIEQWGKMSISRVSAGCRPLLDKWINGTNGINHVSLNKSTTPTLIEDEDDISLGEDEGQQLDSDESALEVRKRSATDAWLDTSCDTLRCKKLKLCTSELNSSTNKSCADNVGCWSLSGSSVTSESSLEDKSEDEDEDEDDVEIED